MPPTNIYEKIEELAETSGRYHPQAFMFTLKALQHCRDRVKREGHVTGQELTESLRLLAISEYGPMAKSVLNHWGVETTEDFGRIVFQMVESGLLGKTEEDSLDDFRDGFDFETEFVRNYHW